MERVRVDERQISKKTNTKCAIAQNTKKKLQPKISENKSDLEDFRFVITVQFLHLHFSAMKSGKK